MALWVKICGITLPQDAAAAVAAGADAIGINFFAGSKRYCDPGAARAIVAAAPAGFPVYGVFVDAGRERIREIVGASGINAIQLHGDEPEGEAAGWDLPVIRAIKATSRERVAAALAAPGDCRLLIDNAAGGGSGKLVGEDLLAGLDLSGAVLAGGLTPANIADIVARLGPFGVDCAGGVEVRAGVKDHRAIREFIENARFAA